MASSRLIKLALGWLWEIKRLLLIVWHRLGVKNYTKILDHVLNRWVKMGYYDSTNKGYFEAKQAPKKAMVELFKQATKGALLVWFHIQIRSQYHDSHIIRGVD